MTNVTAQPDDELRQLVEHAYKESKRLREQSRRTVQAFAALDEFLAERGIHFILREGK